MVPENQFLSRAIFLVAFAPAAELKTWMMEDAMFGTLLVCVGFMTMEMLCIGTVCVIEGARKSDEISKTCNVIIEAENRPCCKHAVIIAVFHVRE